eukprot:gene7040-7254_t
MSPYHDKLNCREAAAPSCPFCEQRVLEACTAAEVTCHSAGRLREAVRSLGADASWCLERDELMRVCQWASQVGCPGPALTFDFLFCPLCSSGSQGGRCGNIQVMTAQPHLQHQLLQGAIEKHLLLREQVVTLAKAHLKLAGMTKHADLQPGGQYDGRPADYALLKFQFFECSKCHQADHMFTYKRTVLYCSAANTSNICVFGRLTADPCSHTSSAAAAPSEAGAEQGSAIAEAEDNVRKFLSLRCLWPAANLLAAEVKNRQLQLQALAWTAAGLADFFLAAYRQQAQRWAVSMFKDLSDEQIQEVHEMAFELWASARDGRKEYRLVNVSRQAAAHRIQLDTNAAGQRQQQEVVHDAGLVHECVVSRGGRREATCPITSGFVFLGVCQHNSAEHWPPVSTATTTVLPAAAGLASTGAGYLSCDVAASKDLAVAACGCSLADMRQQPWLAAASNMSSAVAVFAAVEAGLLPDVLDYAGNGTAEWIEFAVPDRHQVAKQQQEWRQSLQDHTSSNPHMNPLPILSPVLWFRFLPSPAAAADADAAEDVEEDEDDIDVGEDVWFDVFHDQQQQEPEEMEGEALEAGQEQGQLDQQQEHSEDSSLQDDGLSDTSSDPSEGHQQDVAVTQQEHQGLARPMQGTAAPAAAAASGESSSNGGAAADGEPTSSLPPSAPGSPSGPLPRMVVQDLPVCTEAPELLSTATEVAAALGWQASSTHSPEVLYVTLKQPRVGSLVCLRLIDADDRKPSFNAAHGGCNIDVAMVMLRGRPLAPLLPEGLNLG